MYRRSVKNRRRSTMVSHLDGRCTLAYPKIVNSHAFFNVTIVSTMILYCHRFTKNRKKKQHLVLLRGVLYVYTSIRGGLVNL